MPRGIDGITRGGGLWGRYKIDSVPFCAVQVRSFPESQAPQPSDNPYASEYIDWIQTLTKPITSLVR